MTQTTYLKAMDTELVPLLVPDMPSPQTLMVWLQRMHGTRQYSNFGPLVRELESKFAHRFGVSVDELTTVANATLGLELVLKALELPKGSQILLPALTFVASATAVVRAGHVPVLADVDAEIWMLTPEIARNSCANLNIGAVLSVATFGMPCDMEAWQKFEQDTGIPVVVDAASAYGSQWLHKGGGTLVFSLHATKSLPAGEGGVVVSSRSGLAARVRQLSNFGINLDATASVPVGALSEIGTNAKMSEYHAAIALASLEVWDSRAQQRRELYTSLVKELDQASDGNFSWQSTGPGGPLMAPTLLCAKLPNSIARDTLELDLLKAQVSTRRWYQPLLSNMAALQKQCRVLEAPNAQDLSQTLLGLPFFIGMNERQRMRIGSACAQNLASKRR